MSAYCYLHKQNQALNSIMLLNSTEKAWSATVVAHPLFCEDLTVKFVLYAIAIP